jgi:hypothetical protein
VTTCPRRLLVPRSIALVGGDRRRGGVLVEVEVTPLRVGPGSVVPADTLIRLQAAADGVDTDADELEEAG